MRNCPVAAGAGSTFGKLILKFIGFVGGAGAGAGAPNADLEEVAKAKGDADEGDEGARGDKNRPLLRVPCALVSLAVAAALIADFRAVTCGLECIIDFGPNLGRPRVLGIFLVNFFCGGGNGGDGNSTDGIVNLL